MQRCDPARPARRRFLTGELPHPHLWVLGILILIAILLRCHRLGEQSLWLDEFYSLASSAGRYPDMDPLVANRVIEHCPSLTSMRTARPWAHIWTSMREGTHPPLYILILRGWRTIFGDSALAARALSVVASMIALLLMYNTGRLMLGRTGAIWAVVLMAVAWPQIEHGQEARPYPLLLMLGLAAMNALVRIEELGVNRRRLVGLGLAMLAMALTHYLCIGALGALLAYALIRLRGRPRRATVLAMVLAGVVYMAAWGPSMWAQRRNTDFDFTREPRPGPALATMWRFDAVPQRLLVETMWQQPIPGLGLIICALPVALLFRRRRWLLAYLWLIGTVGAVAVLDVFRQTRLLEYLRYTFLAGPGLYLLLGAVGSRWPSAGGTALAALAMYCALTLPYYFKQNKSSFQAMARLLGSRAAPGDALVIAAPRIDWYGPVLYMAVSHYAYDPSRTTVLLDRPADEAILRRLRDCRRVWLVGFDVDPSWLLPGCRGERAGAFRTAWVWQLSIAESGGE